MMIFRRTSRWSASWTRSRGRSSAGAAYVDERRDKLAAEQAAFLRAMHGHADAPAGFDARQVQLAATSLLNKRSKAAANAWPELKKWLGARWQASFEAYASQQPLPEDADGRTDGYAFARWVARS